jgi:hypothetical protein
MEDGAADMTIPSPVRMPMAALPDVGEKTRECARSDAAFLRR